MDASLRQLELFVHVATTGSFTEAAQLALVTQPGISRTVRDLEHQLNVKLFERTTRSVLLTPEGSEFLAVASDILETYKAGMGRFAGYLAGSHGTVNLACLPAPAASLVPNVIQRFLRENPGVRVQILDGAPDEVIARVRTGAADLCIAEANAAGPGLDTTDLYAEPVLAVLAPGHPLAQRSELTWRDLADEQFVAFVTGSGLRRLTDAAFELAGLRPAGLVEARGISTVAGLVAAGLGVTAVPRLLVPLMSFAGLVERPLSGPVVIRHLAMHARQNPPLSPAAARLRDFLLENPDFSARP